MPVNTALFSVITFSPLVQRANSTSYKKAVRAVRAGGRDGVDLCLVAWLIATSPGLF